MWSKFIRFIKWFFLGETAHADNTMNLVPLKVKIGLRENGHADHPDWTKLPSIGNDNTRAHAPFSWMYDKICGHEEIREGAGTWDSPRGMQWGVFLCKRAFADEALATFPDTITELTEVEFEDFYDNYHKGKAPEFQFDNTVLESLKLERELKITTGVDTANVDVRIAKALDPDDSTLGKVRSINKKWVDFKAKNKVTIG